MSKTCKKLLAILIIIQFTLILATFSIIIVESQDAVIIRIIDAKTGSSSITVGNKTEPLPPEGHAFTVNVTLDGFIEKLTTYQIAVSFNQTKVKCTTAWISETDPDFLFHGRSVSIPKPHIVNDLGYVVLGAGLQNVFDPVTVSQGIFCQINFTAIKNGTSTLDIIPTYSKSYPDDTFLWDDLFHDIPFTSQSLSVTVITGRSPPIASFTFSPSNPKPDETITFDASKSYDPDGNITSYVWDFGDSTNLTATSETITHNYTSTGAYHVNLTVFDNNGLYNSIAQDVLVGGPPYTNFTYDWEQKDEYPLNPYSNITVTFNASASFDPDGYITLHIWDFGDDGNATSTNITITHSFTLNGIYHVKLTVFDNDGLYNSMAQRIFIGIRPVANFTFSPELPNPDEQIVFNAYGQGLLSYDSDGYIIEAIWDFGDGDVTETNVTESSDLITGHVYAGQGGVYPVNLTVFDDDGLYTTVINNVNVTVIHTELDSGIKWESYAAAGVIFGAIIVVAIWYKKRPEKEPSREERYRVI